MSELLLAAGVLPYTYSPQNELFFLLSQDAQESQRQSSPSYSSKWCEFWDIKSYTDPTLAHTASRAFSEQTCGVYTEQNICKSSIWMLNKLLKEAHAFQTDTYLIYIVQIPYLDAVKFNISTDLVMSDSIQEIRSQNKKKLDFRWISGQILLQVLEQFEKRQVTYYVPESIDFLEHFLVILQHERLSLLLRELVSQAQAIQELHADNNLLNHIFFQPKTFIRSSGGETLPINDTEKMRRIKSIDPQISEETASFYRSVTKINTPNTIMNTSNSSNGSPLNKKKQKKVVRFESPTKIDTPFFVKSVKSIFTQ